MRRVTIVLAILFGVIGLACSQEAAAFDDLSDLRDAVSGAGVACAEIDEGPEAEVVSESGECTGSGVRLFMFEDEDDLEDWKKVGTRLNPAAIGANWAAMGGPADLRRISDELGAEIVSSP